MGSLGKIETHLKQHCRNVKTYILKHARVWGELRPLKPPTRSRYRRTKNHSVLHPRHRHIRKVLFKPTPRWVAYRHKSHINY